jgi:hypothetical protein
MSQDFMISRFEGKRDLTCGGNTPSGSRVFELDVGSILEVLELGRVDPRQLVTASEFVLLLVF